MVKSLSVENISILHVKVPSSSSLFQSASNSNSNLANQYKNSQAPAAPEAPADVTSSYIVPITFSWTPSRFTNDGVPTIKSVEIAGTFNGWRPEKMIYSGERQVFEYVLHFKLLDEINSTAAAANGNNGELSLSSPSTCSSSFGYPIYYKFIVDGVWRINEKVESEYDNVGNLNNVLWISTVLVEEGNDDLILVEATSTNNNNNNNHSTTNKVLNSKDNSLQDTAATSQSPDFPIQASDEKYFTDLEINTVPFDEAQSKEAVKKAAARSNEKKSTLTRIFHWIKKGRFLAY